MQNQDVSKFSKGSRPRTTRIWAVTSLLLIVSMACNLPFSKKTEEKSAATVAPSALPLEREDLPPVVVETTPLSGSILPLQGSIGLIFDQPMERESVEGAIQLNPAYSGRFEWLDETSVEFISDQPLPPDTPITINIAATARAKNGLALLRSQEFSFQTAGNLRIAERIPADGLSDVDPASTIAVTFNQPIVPIGEIEETLPKAFSIDPPARGSGRWLNSSTYIFQPDLSLGGGVTYSIHVNPELTSLAGSSLEEGELTVWSFTTAIPQVLWANPDPGSTIWLDDSFTVMFNQSMDRQSVEQNLSLLDRQGRAVPGSFTWEEADKQVIFQPAELLQRSNRYRLVLGDNAQSSGGSTLAEQVEYTYQSVGALDIAQTTPGPGLGISTYRGYSAIILNFNAPIAKGQNLEELVQIDPEPASYRLSFSSDEVTLHLSGFYESDQTYRVAISPNLKDRWGGQLSQAYIRSLWVADFEPELNIPMLWASSRVIYSLPEESTLQASATNISSLAIQSASLSVEDVVYSFNARSESLEFQPEETWTQTFDLPRNKNQIIDINLTPDGSALEPGMYQFKITSPQISRDYYDLTFWLVVSRMQLTMKLSQNELFVWAVDGQKRSVVSGKIISVYDSDYKLAGSAKTDASGVARIDLADFKSPRGYYMAVLGETGDADFSAGFTFWQEGIQPWDFQLTSAGAQSDLKAYFYTDRPIYRPGQTVYFRGVLREPADARYHLPELESLQIEVRGVFNPETGEYPLVASLQESLSAYGTVDGEFTIPEDSKPGTYWLQINDDGSQGVGFIVAEYRKPEIDLEVSFGKAEYKRGEDIQAGINASYFFGAEASHQTVSWNLYARENYYYLPGGYSTGPMDTSWLQPVWFFGFRNPLGQFLTGGEAKTDENGRLDLTFTAEQIDDLLADPSLFTLSLEATLYDETGMPLSQRASAKVHPSIFYIGIKPEVWDPVSGEPLGFAIQTADWQQKPSGSHKLTASFQKVAWKQDQATLEIGDIKYTKELTLIASSDFETDAAGRARLEFTPKEPGTYQLEVSGGGALSQSLVWVSGAGSAQWPILPEQHLRLETDRTEYKAGNIARIFIPNPYSGGALALVTVERANVLRSQVFEIEGASHILELELEEGDAPNVYVSVLLLGTQESKPDFRQGYIELKVNPEFLELQVDLIPEQEKLEPGQTARAEMIVKDSQGNPVQGEFSLAVVDAAIFALAEPNAADIREAFYGKQPLRVRSSLSLAAYNRRITLEEPGRGGGGGGEVAQVPGLRESFKDTAYWNATIETDANGHASIEFIVPDNLTTWVMTVKGIDRTSKVGETTANIVVSKNLLIRPATPRFLVVGDRVMLSAVVHNNTEATLEVKVNLTAKGVKLDEADLPARTFQLAARSSQRVDWWASVQNAHKAELVFSAVGGGYQDASTPTQGAIPILRYSTPATFATNGVLSEGGETLEIISLPRSYTPTGGELSVELSSTLAGTVLSGLKAMDEFPYDFSEAVISRLFANLAVYNLLHEAAVESPDLSAKLQNEIRTGLAHLARLQNNDGGWGWCTGQKSDLYISSYALLAISQASTSGFFVDSERQTAAQGYVAGALYAVKMASEDWELDRLTLAQYALKQSGEQQLRVDDLYQARKRLSPWGQALLAMAMGDHQPAEARVLLSDLQASAVRSATGAYWQDTGDKWYNHVNPMANTAMAILALAEYDPASPLLTEAVRYLSLNRRVNGGWYSSFDSAWCIYALSRVLRVTGDLQGSFAYSATINGTPLASGKAAGVSTLNPVIGTTDLAALNTDYGNALRILREAGPGRLYYRAYLQLDTPVENVVVLNKGISIERNYSLIGADCPAEGCPALKTIQLAQPSPVIQVRLAVTLQNDLYDLVVEDFIPAGAEIVNTRLQTSQLGVPQFTTSAVNSFDIYSNGWGWWRFSSPYVYDDHIRWVASYLPAGTYILTYRLQPLQAGEFRVLPAHAYAYYFPEVEGRSAGEVFTIKE